MTSPTDPEPKSKPAGRAWAWRIAKWGACGAVLAFVALRARDLWGKEEISAVAVSPGWLIAAMLAYLVGWLPSAWYWQRLMRTFGNDVPLIDVARSYFCGHLGKYMPGKAGVLLIRAGMLKTRGYSAAIAALTATVETLLLMGTGLALGLALFPILNWPPVVADYISPAFAPLIVLGLVLLALPIIGLLLRRVAVLMMPRNLDREAQATRIDAKLIAIGLGVFCVSWALHGLSLGFTILSVAPESASFDRLPVWIGTVSLAASIGFLAIFAPGGIGVREGLLIEILRVQPDIAPRQAVVIAVLLRLIWLAAEIIAAGGVYYGVRARGSDD